MEPANKHEGYEIKENSTTKNKNAAKYLTCWLKLVNIGKLYATKIHKGLLGKINKLNKRKSYLIKMSTCKKSEWLYVLNQIKI